MTALSRLGIRTLIVVLVLPLAMVATGVILLLSWLPELPETVAVHWGPNGADGFAPAWTVPTMLTAVGGGIAVLFTAVVAGAATRRGERNIRLLATVTLAVVTLLTVVLTWSTGMQRGIEFGDAVPGVIGPLLGGLVAAALAAVVAALILPRTIAVERESAPAAAPAELPATARTAWMRTASASPGSVVVAIGALLLVTVAVVAAISVATPVVWPVAVVPALLVILLLFTLRMRVRVDERGVQVRGLLGVPRITVPLDRITSAAVVDVSPLADFGGWGFRYAPGRSGVVLRAGEALEVRRDDDSALIVTVDDAASAASVLAALVERARARR